MVLCFEKYIAGPHECCKWPGKAWKAKDGTKGELDFSAEFLRTAQEAGDEEHRNRTKGGGRKSQFAARGPSGGQGRDSMESHGQGNTLLGMVMSDTEF